MKALIGYTELSSNLFETVITIESYCGMRQEQFDHLVNEAVNELASIIDNEIIVIQE